MFAANVTPENIEWVSLSRFMLLAVLDIAITFDGAGVGSPTTAVSLTETVLFSVGVTAATALAGLQFVPQHYLPQMLDVQTLGFSLVNH